MQTTVGGIFMASGPLIGGVLTETISWRMIFWIGIPVVLGIAMLLWIVWSPKFDGQSQASRPQKPDRIAPAYLVLGLSGLVTAVMQGPDWGWASAMTIGIGLAGAALLVLFYSRETNHPSPLLDLSLLKIPEFGGGVVIFALFQLEKIAVFVFAAQYFQDVLGKSPIISGLAVSLAILPTLVTSVLIGKATDKLGSRITLVRGVLIHATALILFALATLQDNFVLAVIPLVLWGASMPSIAIPVRRVQMNSVPADKHAQASGITMTIQMLGGSLGLALCVALLAETQSYPLLFGFVGLATLSIVWIGRGCIEPRPGKNR